MSAPISTKTAELESTLRAETHKAIARCRTYTYGPFPTMVRLGKPIRRLLRNTLRYYVETEMKIDKKYSLLLDRGEIAVFDDSPKPPRAISISHFLFEVIIDSQSDQENQQIVNYYINLLKKL